MPGAPEAARWKGRETVGSDGEKTGAIEAVYLDDATGEPAWAAVTHGTINLTVRIVPVHDARPDGDVIRLAYDRAAIDAAPELEVGDALSPADERRLAAHYASR